MTRTETFTQTTNTPISTAAIRETQQLDNTRRIFTQLLQEYIASLQPPSHDTNRLALEIVPCAHPDLVSASDSLSASGKASVPVIASQPPAADPESASKQPSASLVTSTPEQTSSSVITPPLVPCLDPGLASASNPTDHFTIYQQPLATITPQPVQWLWQQRLPLAGITLLDGDHGTGKTLLAHQIAAAVSSGSPMPDGTPTIGGGVIIITPNTDASTTQLQLLTDLQADLSRIQILSFIHDPASSSHPSGSRPFSLPEDLPRLFDTIDRLDARLIILDPFIHTLSRQRHCTNHHLTHLLTDLNQYLIERNVACLLIRNCPARGGHARPSALERSDDFPIIATSRLLLAPDPIEPDRILLSHALSRHAALTPTLMLHIQPLPTNPNLAHFTIDGTHRLTASQLLTQRPDTLHRHLLSQHLYTIIAHATKPTAATTLYTQSPHSSPFQIQRSLNDLLQTGQILRPTPGLYSLNPTATTQLDALATTTLIPTEPPKLDSTAAITLIPTEPPKLDSTAAITPNHTAVPNLNHTAATTPNPTITTKLDSTAAITPTPPKAKTAKLDSTAATTHNPKASRPHKHKKWHGRPGQSKKRT